MKRSRKRVQQCPKRAWNVVRTRSFAALVLVGLCTLCLYEVFLTEAYLSELNIQPTFGPLHDDDIDVTNDNDDYPTPLLITAKRMITGRGVAALSTSPKKPDVVTTPKMVTAPRVDQTTKKPTAKPLPKANPHTKRVNLPPLVKTFPPAPDDSQNKPGPNTKYLVYLCDSHLWCGGWGDRQKGLTSAYLLARVTERQFKLIMSTPCDLATYFAPHRVKWQPMKGELDTNSQITLYGIGNQTLTDIIKSSNFTTMFPQKVIYFRTNGDYYYHLRHNAVYSKLLSTWSALSDKKTRFRWAWNDLMQPTDKTLKMLENLVGPRILIRRGLISKPLDSSVLKRTGFKEVGDSSLVCAHVRIGKNPTLPMDNEVVKFHLEDVPALFEFMLAKGKERDSRFFVATDYGFVRNLTRTFFTDRAVSYGGSIVHIDRQRSEDSACEGFGIANVEQLLLSLCDYLVISDSGFSLHAAFISNSSTGHVYQMDGGRIKNRM